MVDGAAFLVTRNGRVRRGYSWTTSSHVSKMSSSGSNSSDKTSAGMNDGSNYESTGSLMSTMSVEDDEKNCEDNIVVVGSTKNEEKRRVPNICSTSSDALKVHASFMYPFFGCSDDGPSNSDGGSQKKN